MKKGTRATTVAQSSKSTLRAINDIVIIEEDPIDYETDKPSGLTKEVVESLKAGTLVTPDIAEYYVKKWPCTGTIISFGSRCKNKDILEVGMRVSFPKEGVCRETIEGTKYVFIRDDSIHAILN